MRGRRGFCGAGRERAHARSVGPVQLPESVPGEVADTLQALEVRIHRPDGRPVRAGSCVDDRIRERKAVFEAEPRGEDRERGIQIDHPPFHHGGDDPQGRDFTLLLEHPPVDLVEADGRHDQVPDILDGVCEGRRV